MPCRRSSRRGGRFGNAAPTSENARGGAPLLEGVRKSYHPHCQYLVSHLVSHFVQMWYPNPRKPDEVRDKVRDKGVPPCSRCPQTLSGQRLATMVRAFGPRIGGPPGRPCRCHFPPEGGTTSFRPARYNPSSSQEAAPPGCSGHSRRLKRARPRRLRQGWRSYGVSQERRQGGRTTGLLRSARGG